MAVVRTVAESPLVGRDAELSDIASVLGDRSPVLLGRLIDGPPGAGKTALLNAALEEATRSGLTVLRASPAAAESTMPFAALADLFGELDPDQIASLQEPQRHALSAALMHEASEDAAAGQHAIARAALSLVRTLAEERPVVLAIDDLQWLDSASSRTLLFALRRLRDAPVRVLVARRPAEAEDWWDALRRALPEYPRWRLPLGPLTVDDIATLLGSRLKLTLPRPTLVAIHRRSEGNPLFALELGRSVRERSDPGRTFDPSDDDLASLLADRLRALSDDARRAVVATSLASHPTLATLTAVSSAAAIDEAVRAEVLLRDAARVRFVHPLFGSVAESSASPTEIEQIHAALAALVDDDEEAALHRARGTSTASAETAAATEAAADRAVRRGAPELASQLAEHAARLTPPGDETARRRRLVAAADNLLSAGDPQRARRLLEQVAGELEAGPERADVLWRLADSVGDDLPLSTRLSEQALSEAGDDAELKASIRLALGVFTWLEGNLWASADHVREAARLAEESGNQQLMAIAFGEVLHAEAVLGVPSDPGLIERALALEAQMDSFPAGVRPSFQQAVVDLYTDRVEEARPLLEAELRRTEASGDESARVAALFRLSELELRAGNWGRALRFADECVALAAQAAIEQEQCVALNASAAVAAHLGRVDEAVTAARQALAIAVDGGDEMSELRSRGVLGFVALSTGHLAEADDWLAPAMATIQRLDIGELSIYGVVQNQLDVLIRLARLDEAQSLVELIERKAATQQRAWHFAVAARGRALLAGARGDGEEALRLAELALADHVRLPQPFELGRTLLAKGSIERRHRRRAAARKTLTQALEVFDGLGAALWAEAAAAELARIGGRVATAGSLTETEARVAELVAEGLSNSEIAGRLFVTVRTVEAHLSRIYGKLGSRSRVDLVRWASSQPPRADLS